MIKEDLEKADIKTCPSCIAQVHLRTFCSIIRWLTLFDFACLSPTEKASTKRSTSKKHHLLE